jgi:hypothetical protein
MAPVIDPNGVIDRIVTDTDGNTGVESQCRRSIPSTANRVTDQLIVYKYDVATVAGTDMFLIIDKIATQVQREISSQFLICTFDDTTTTSTNDVFFSHTISSLPIDIVDTTTTTTVSNCTSDDNSTDCFRVNAAFTATIFYLDDNTNTRRSLQNGTTSTKSDAITDPMVYESFSSSLQALFSSGKLTDDISSVLSTDFQGIANDGRNDTPTSSPDDNSGSQTDKSLSSGAVAGSVIGTLIGLALIAVLVVLAITAFRRRNDDSENSRKKAMDVTQQEFNDLHIDEDDDERDDRAMIDRSIIASDDGSFDSGYHNDGRFKTTAYLANDDNESLNTRGFPLVEPSFSERIRSAGEPGPIFVKTNEASYPLNEAALKPGIDFEMGPVEMTSRISSAQRSTGQRSYGVSDTVQL